MAPLFSCLIALALGVVTPSQDISQGLRLTINVTQEAACADTTDFFVVPFSGVATFENRGAKAVELEEAPAPKPE